MAAEANPERRSHGAWILLVFPLLGIIMALVTLVGPLQTGSQIPNPSMPIPSTVVEGQPAPDFTAATPDGETYTLRHLQGVPVAINFWATWCAPCEAEMPALQKAQERYAETGFLVLAVNAGEPASEVQAFMANRGLSFPALLDPDGEILDLYGVNAFPSTIWVDAEGIVRAKHLGVLTRAAIDRYLSDMLALPAAPESCVSTKED